MMIQKDSAPPEPNRSMRHALRVGSIVFVCTSALSFAALIVFSAATIPDYTPNRFAHPMIVYTPFTMRRGDASHEAIHILKLPAYAKAIVQEVHTFTWQADPSQTSAPKGLAVIRLEVAEQASIVSSWYESNFPKPSAKLGRTQIQEGLGKEQWYKKLHLRLDEGTTLFQTTSGEFRGVVVEPEGERRTRLTLFYYSPER